MNGDITSSDHASGSAVDVRKPVIPPMTGKQRENARFSFALGLTHPAMYEGTVPRAEKERRRAKNRVARKARAQQRRR